MGLQDREQLIVEHLWIVEVLARSFGVSANDVDDLRSAGNEALCLAARRYRRGRAAFKSYAYACVRGAMLTALRKKICYERIEDIDAIAPVELRWWEQVDGRALTPAELLVVYAEVVLGCSAREIAIEMRARLKVIQGLEEKVIAKLP